MQFTSIILQAAKTANTPFWQETSWKVAAFTGLLAALLALIQASLSLRQRSRDMRWKQAELARNMMDEWFDFVPSDNALRMFDEGAGEYEVEKYGKHLVQPNIDIPKALSFRYTEAEKEKYQMILRCLDTLFYYFDRAEHSLNIKVVRFEDMQFPTEYYIKRMVKYKEQIDQYLPHVGHDRAKDFLYRFEAWRNPGIKKQ